MDLDVLHAEVQKLKKIVLGAEKVALNADAIMAAVAAAQSVSDRIAALEKEIGSFPKFDADAFAAAMDGKLESLKAEIDELGKAFAAITPPDAPADVPADVPPAPPPSPPPADAPPAAPTQDAPPPAADAPTQA